MAVPFIDIGDDEAVGALARGIGALPHLEDRLELIARRYEGAGERIAFSTSLGIEDQTVLAAIAARALPVDVFTLDTGRHFPETLDTIEASENRFGIKIRIVAPEAEAVAALVAGTGINCFRASTAARKACCEVRKVEPLRRTLAGAAAWITGLRRGQSPGRNSVPFIERDPLFSGLKFNPIADWSLGRLEEYVRSRDVPLNPLHARGFPSIGCQPCTRAVAAGEDIRAGRWWWESEGSKECGLHARPLAVGAVA